MLRHAAALGLCPFLAISAVVLPASHAAEAAQPAAAGGRANLVQPESLDSGFVIVVTDKSGQAGPNSPIFLASSHNGWNPGDRNAVLTPRSDSKWQIDLPKPTLDSRLSFKFTRGSWDEVETHPDFTDIDNRMLPLIDATKLRPGEKPVIEFVVEAWADQRPNRTARAAIDPYRAITVSDGSIRRVETVGGGVPIVRDVLVWLPPGYDAPENADRRYPVLYLQDGQNLFEPLPNLPGEWRVDETAAALIKSGKIEPLIVVGIPHAGNARMSEYAPVQIADGTPARGDAYADYLVGEVMPRIERAFRVRTDPQSTAIGGSSLGALISLHTALRHPGRFGAVLLESPSLLVADGAPLRHFAAASDWPARVYIGMGGRETGPTSPGRNAAYVRAASDLDAMARAKGVPDAARKLVIAETAEHNENAWAERLPAALQFLFPAR